MIEGSLNALAASLDGRLIGDDRPFRGVAIDSRQVAADELFVALRGERFDAHDFLGKVAGSEAAGALVSTAHDIALPQVEVADTRIALGRMGAQWRARFELPVIGVTGSNGKTTVKEMLGAILRVSREALVTAGNFNNDVGLPLTLLRLGAGHEAAVIEMGTSGPGEIAYLAGLTRPDVAVITNAAAAHLEGLGDVAAVAREKGAIVSALSAGGVAVLNADDPYLPVWRERAGARRVVTFGRSGDADFAAREVSHAIDGDGVRLVFRLDHPGGELAVSTPAVGAHNAVNAACAAAAALAIGASPTDVVRGLEDVRGARGRLQPLAGRRGARLIDDTYNANPASMRAGIDFVTSLPGRAWLVMGDMAELGPDGPVRHAEAGRDARRRGVERLFAYGPASRDAVEAFGVDGTWFDDLSTLVATLSDEVDADVNLLVKGSRSARMERVVEALVVDARPEGG